MFLQVQLWWLLVVYKPPCLWRDPPGTKILENLPSAKKPERWCLDFHWNIKFAQSGVGESQAKRSSSTTGSSKKAASDGLLFSWSKTLTFDIHFPIILNGWSIQFFYSFREKMVVPNRKSARISTMCNLRGLPTVVKNIWSCPEQPQKKRCKRALCAALTVYIDVAPSGPSCLSYPSYLFCLFCP